MLSPTLLPGPLFFAAPRLDAHLQLLAKLAGIAMTQLHDARLERATDALRQSPTAGQLLDAAQLAQRLEQSLPDHAGTALRTRALLCIGLLDPPGADRLAASLCYARQVLGY